MDLSDPTVQFILFAVLLVVLVVVYQELYTPGPRTLWSLVRSMVSGKKPKKEKKGPYVWDAGAGPLPGVSSPTSFGSVAARMNADFGSYDESGVLQGVPEFFEKPVQTSADASNRPALQASSLQSGNQDVVPSYQPGKVKEALKPEDLLPQDKNSVWAQVNPEGSGSLQYKNFLEAGYHIGIDTIGSSKRNANRQLRPDIPNPRSNVGPWMNAVIDQDYNISKPLL